MGTLRRPGLSAPPHRAGPLVNQRVSALPGW